MTALLAGVEGSEDGEPYLWGIYIWRDGQWLSEDTLQPVTPEGAWWWVPETEILPAVECVA